MKRVQMFKGDPLSPPTSSFSKSILSLPTPPLEQKAQVSLEFMMVVLALLAALSVITGVGIIKTQEIQVFSLQNEAEDVLRGAANAINTVSFEGDGFRTNLTLPQTILGFNYTIAISSHYLSLAVQNNTHSRVLLTNVSGILKKGPNTIFNNNTQVTIL